MNIYDPNAFAPKYSKLGPRVQSVTSYDGITLILTYLKAGHYEIRDAKNRVLQIKKGECGWYVGNKPAYTKKAAVNRSFDVFNEMR